MPRRLAFLFAFLAGTVACRTDSPEGTSGRLYLPWGSLYYRVLGRGSDTILVLHGGPGFHHGYLVPALRPLAERHTLIFYDQRGRGLSDWPPDTADQPAAEGDVTDLEALRSHFRLEHFAVIGHHWGAGLAFLYAQRHPTRVTRIAMLDPIYPRQGWLYYVAQTVHDPSAIAGWAEARRLGEDSTRPRSFCEAYWGFSLSPAVVTDALVVSQVAGPLCDVPDAALRRMVTVNHRVLSSLREWDWLPDIPRVDVPVLIVQGDGGNQPAANDALEQASREWIRYLPHARITVVEGDVAFPWIQNPRVVREALESFLSPLPEASAAP